MIPFLNSVLRYSKIFLNSTIGFMIFFRFLSHILTRTTVDFAFFCPPVRCQSFYKI